MATAPNLGTGGTALDAQYGSSSTSNTNEPLLLAHTGENYLYLPGGSAVITGNLAQTPDAVSMQITGDLEMVFRLRPDDWTPTSPACVGGKDNTSTTRGYALTLAATGVLSFHWSTLGTDASAVTKSSTVAVPFADGTTGWIRVTFDVDNGASGNDVKFYTAPDSTTEPTVWTQLGTTVTTAGVASIFATTAPFTIGYARAGTVNWAGRVYRAIVRNGIAGTTVFDANFTTGITSGAQASFVESSSNAATVTINRSTSGRKSVAVVRSVWLLGTDDFFEVADAVSNGLLDFGLTDSFTVWAVIRQWTSAAEDVIVAKTENVGTSMLGYAIFNNAGPFSSNRFGDGTNRQLASDGVGGTLVSGAVQFRAMVRDTASDTHRSYLNATAGTAGTDTTTATLANSFDFRIGRFSGSGTNYAEMELLAAGVHRRALSATELTQIASYYGVV